MSEITNKLNFLTKENDFLATKLTQAKQTIEKIKKVAQEYESSSLSQRQVWSILEIIKKYEEDK